jgi:hypothetical protein
VLLKIKYFQGFKNMQFAHMVICDNCEDGIELDTWDECMEFMRDNDWFGVNFFVCGRGGCFCFL